jgi:hypothetical protein
MPHVPAWKSEPLYAVLVDRLPSFVKPSGALNMKSLREALGRSPEALYKWLRTSKISPETAQQLLALAQTDNNRRLLRDAKRPGPRLQDFSPYVFG